MSNWRKNNEVSSSRLELPPLLALELVYCRNCFSAAHLLYFAKLMPFTPASGFPRRQLEAFLQRATALMGEALPSPPSLV
jgi:hypothetical protein